MFSPEFFRFLVAFTAIIVVAFAVLVFLNGGTTGFTV